MNASVNANINLTANNYNNNYNNNNNNNTNNQNNTNNNNNGGTPGTPGTGGGDNSNSNTNIINNVITATSSSVSNASSISNSTATGGAGGIGIGIGSGSGGGAGGGGGTTNVYAYGGNAYATGSGNGTGGAGGSATANAYGSAFSDSLGIGFGGGGGGGGQMFFTPPMATGYIQGLSVEGPSRRQKVAFEATRTTTRRVMIQAFCLDDRDIPHPASQLSPDREIGEFEGEIFRCIAGTRLQYVVAEYKAQFATCLTPGGSGAGCFNGGQTVVCNKSDSLYYSPNGKGGGALSCRPQKPARDCNERSLLRRFGAGIKLLTIVSEERYTDYREEVVRESSSSVVTNLALDGGVGGVAY